MDLDDEELKATRKLNGIDKNVGSIEEDIKILEVENYYLEELGYLRENNHFIKFNQALKNLIKAYKEEKEENESADRVNKALIKQMERNNNIIEDLTNKISELQEEIKDERYFNKHNVEVYKEKTKNSIPVSLVEEKIEELNKLLEEDLQDERKINSNRFIIICQCKSCLQELLEKRK